MAGLRREPSRHAATSVPSASPTSAGAKACLAGGPPSNSAAAGCARSRSQRSWLKRATSMESAPQAGRWSLHATATLPSASTTSAGVRASPLPRSTAPRVFPTSCQACSFQRATRTQSGIGVDQQASRPALRAASRRCSQSASFEMSGTMISQPLHDAVGAYEKDLIMDALKSGRGNRARAARLLQTTERILNYKVRKYAIDYQRFKV